MIHLDLTPDEQQTITAVLENYLSDLRMEIADTDRMAYREKLKERKRIVRKVLDAVRPATTSASA